MIGKYGYEQEEDRKGSEENGLNEGGGRERERERERVKVGEKENMKGGIERKGEQRERMKEKRVRKGERRDRDGEKREIQREMREHMREYPDCEKETANLIFSLQRLLFTGRTNTTAHLLSIDSSPTRERTRWTCCL